MSVRENNSQTEEDLNNFLSLIQSSNLFSSEVIGILYSSLKVSDLKKIYIDGSKSGIRLDDEHISYLTSAIERSNIELDELSLPHHKVTGILNFIYSCI
jgi:hypothetical protein